ncbi:hypothetical protein NQ314_018000 [Rhamnusium bicolor]|uniref:CCHC-type domain-containing protein n=1 Tax=Rhamnusium bicolor TaxID=1586634 RepID=A0AAV8WS48_9CUCU|nr:hypothetical protein NQ314_018000 [Rhamnusium bicolor]
MEFLVANVDHIKFDIEVALDEQFGALPLPFPGMDKSTAAVCQFYASVVGCQKDLSVLFDMYEETEPLYVNIGFVVCVKKQGIVQKVRKCKYMHPRFELPAPPDQNLKDQKKTPVIICHFCGEHGHKAIHCNKMVDPNKDHIPNDENRKQHGNDNLEAQNTYLQKMLPKKTRRCYMFQSNGKCLDENYTMGEKRIPLYSLADVQLRFLCPDDLDEVRALCQDWFPIEYPFYWYEEITSSARNIIYERAKFNLRTQLKNETGQECIDSLVFLSKTCNYGALIDELVRAKLVVGIRDYKLSEQLQLDDKLRLEKAVAKVIQTETIKEQNKENREKLINGKIDKVTYIRGKNRMA